MSKWPMRPLGEVTTLYGGGTPRRDEPTFWTGDIPWVTPTDLPDVDAGVSTVSTTKDCITAEGLASSSVTLVPEDTVLFSSRATIGKVAVAATPVTTNQGFANFIPGPDMVSRYLAYALWHHRNDIARLSGSTTFKEVSRSTLRGYEVPVPPLAEQERIVRLLDEADTIRKLRARADQRTAELIPALFHQMFGDPATNPMEWPTELIGNLLISPPNYGTMRPASHALRPWLSIRVANLQRGGLDLSDRKYVDLTDSERERHSLIDGDLLIARAIGSLDHLGKAVVVYPGKEHWAFDSHLMRVRPNPASCDPNWLKGLLDTTGGRQLFLAKTRNSAVQFNINSKEFASIRIPLPPAPLQGDYVDRIRLVQAMSGLQTRCESATVALSNELLHGFFAA